MADPVNIFGINLQMEITLEDLAEEWPENVRKMAGLWFGKLTPEGQMIIRILIETAFIRGKIVAGRELMQMIPAFVDKLLKEALGDTTVVRIRRMGSGSLRGIRSLVTTHDWTWFRPLGEAVYFDRRGPKNH